MHIIIKGGAINPIPTPWGNFWVTPENPYALWLIQLQLDLIECVVVHVVVVFLIIVVVVVTPAITVVVISSVFVVNYVDFQNVINIFPLRCLCATCIYTEVSE